MEKTRRGGRQARKQYRASEDEKPQVIKPGLEGGRYKPLSDAEVKYVDAEAKKILSTIGIAEVPQIVIDKALEKGAHLNDKGRLCYPISMIEDIIAGAGRNFVMHGRDEKHDFQVMGTKVHYGTGGAAIQALDPLTDKYRPSTLVDLYDFARIADSMENCHWFTRCVVATDVKDDLELDINTAFACLAGTTKPMGTSFVIGKNVPPIIDMFDAVLGGTGEFKKRPFCKVHISPVISPLRYGEDAVDVMLEVIKHNMPISSIIAAQSGATAPATMSGMLIQTVAETLAGLILVNLFAPGYPMIFSNWPFVLDLRTGAFACGAGEIALLNAASAQMSNYYDLPSGVAGNMGDSKAIDAQAGYEKCLSAVATGLAGANMVYESSGMFASLLGASFEGFVLDNEILGSAQRIIRGFEFNDETYNIETIEDVVNGTGHYLGHDQTIGAMERDYYYPKLSDRESPDTWHEQGSQTFAQRTKKYTLDLLNNYYPNYIPENVEADIRSKHKIYLPESAIRPSDRWKG